MARQTTTRTTDEPHERMPTWSGSLCPRDPANYWIDDATGERVDAHTGQRTAQALPELDTLDEHAIARMDDEGAGGGAR